MKYFLVYFFGQKEQTIRIMEFSVDTLQENKQAHNTLWLSDNQYFYKWLQI